jgi:hypothetical protein
MRPTFAAASDNRRIRPVDEVPSAEASLMQAELRALQYGLILRTRCGSHPFAAL